MGLAETEILRKEKDDRGPSKTCPSMNMDNECGRLKKDSCLSKTSKLVLKFIYNSFFKDLLADLLTRVTRQECSARACCVHALVVQRSVSLRMARVTTVAWDLRVSTVRGVNLTWITLPTADAVYLVILD